MDSINSNPAWGIVWKLKCIAKVNIFVWRALHGTISCRVTLVNHHTEVSSQCPYCKQG